MQQRLPHFVLSKEASEPGQDLQVLADAGRDEEEEKMNWGAIHGAVINSLLVTAENQDRVFRKAGNTVAGVWQGNPVSESSAAKFFACDKGVQKNVRLLRPFAQIGDVAN